VCVFVVVFGLVEETASELGLTPNVGELSLLRSLWIFFGLMGIWVTVLAEGFTSENLC
jgi:hypothetical protein